LGGEHSLDVQDHRCPIPPAIDTVVSTATAIESHLGGGATMRRKPPALRNIGIDLNERAWEIRVSLSGERVHAARTGSWRTVIIRAGNSSAEI
jgi:hypothetical protein